MRRKANRELSGETRGDRRGISVEFGDDVRFWPSVVHRGPISLVPVRLRRNRPSFFFFSAGLRFQALRREMMSSAKRYWRPRLAAEIRVWAVLHNCLPRTCRGLARVFSRRKPIPETVILAVGHRDGAERPPSREHWPAPGGPVRRHESSCGGAGGTAGAIVLETNLGRPQRCSGH